MAGASLVACGSILFAGSHVALSHPLRAPLVRAMGEAAFLGLYSAVAAALMAATVWAFREAPPTAPLWIAGNGLWAVVTAAMLLASVLLAGSFFGNPAFPDGGRPQEVPAAAGGVFAVTRHPMMWSFALWGICHVLVFPAARNVAIALPMAALALVGAALQDRRKRARDPQGWARWERCTGFVPFAAIAAGRCRLRSPGAVALVGGVAIWLVATWAHGPLAGWPAGIWRWIAA